MSITQKGIVSGISAGITQAFVITPLQRLKTIALTDTSKTGINSANLLRQLIEKEGVSTLFKGLQPMIIKRSTDWGIRFGTISYLEKQIKNNNSDDYKLTNLEKVSIGFAGGIVSCITIPFDTWIANCQKHSQVTNLSSIQVAKKCMLNTDLVHLLKVFL
jgi:hypothetical protein